MKDKTPTGAVGSVPPPDAPQERTQPLSSELLASQLAQARANERELAPFNPQPLPRIAPSTPAVPTIATQAMIDDFFGSDVPTVLPAVVEALPLPIEIHPEVDQVEDYLPALSEEDLKRMPAASNSDTPAKGLLPNLTPPTGDKWEGIDRGGFSDPGESQYFPLQGNEIDAVIDDLFEQISKQNKNDLRFRVALTYPRARVRVTVEVEGVVEDNNAGVQIQKVFVPKGEETKGNTPLEIARRHGNEVVFVVSKVRQEFDEEGRSDMPPDQIRDTLHLGKFRKTVVKQGGRHTHVDVLMQGPG